jgi:hypothetical protein
VNSWERFHANFDEAEDLDLVFWNQLGESDQEADLECRQSVVRGTKTVRVNSAFKETRGIQEKVLVAQHGPFDPTETKGDSVAGSNDDDCEPAKFFRSPEFLEVARSEREGDEGDDELFVSHVMREADGSNAPGSCKSHALAFDSFLDVSEPVDCRASWLKSGP